MHKNSVILIVDDELIVRNILAKMLHVMGYITLQASNSTEAQTIIHQKQPDLILLDMIMLGVSSLELIKSVRAKKHLNHIAVILISDCSDLDTVNSFIEAGINDFLPKPFNKALLTLKIDSCLQHQRINTTAQNAHQDIDDFCRELSHDLNNTLTGIMMTAELLLMTPPSDQNRQYIQSIIHATEEVTSIIQQRRQAALVVSTEGERAFTEPNRVS